MASGKRTKSIEKQPRAKRAAPTPRKKAAEPALVETRRVRTTARKKAAEPPAADSRRTRTGTRKQAAAAVPAAAAVRKRTGRRPGVSGSRQAIIEAARAKFAERGYDGATIRSIAQDAGVDAALIHHFFDTKEGLFVAAMQDTFDPQELLDRVLEPGVDGLGERLTRQFLELSDTRVTRERLRAIIRSAFSHGEAADMLRGFVGADLLGRLTRQVDRGEPDLRAVLVAAQLIGLTMMKDIVGINPLPKMDRERLVALVGPTVHEYVVGDLPGAPAKATKAAKTAKTTRGRSTRRTG